MKIAELFESADLKTLYCSRNLLNGEEFLKWAEDQGFKKCLDPSDMHVTIAFSKKKIDWSELTDSFDHIQSTVNKKHPEKTKREVKQFDGGAIVLTFENSDLHRRWEEFKEDFGASWDYPDYHPHITITYDGLPEGMKLEDIEPYEGKLEFGPEIMKELDLNWKAKVKETKLDESIDPKLVGLGSLNIAWTTSQKKNAELAADALRAAGYKAMTANPSGRPMNKHFAAIGSPTNGIFINPRCAYWKDPVTSARIQKEVGHLSTDNPIGVLLHEIGHTMYEPPGHWLAPSQKDVAGQVSKYAMSNPKEFVSEVIAGLHTGRNYSDEVMRLYDMYTREHHRIK